MTHCLYFGFMLCTFFIYPSQSLQTTDNFLRQNRLTQVSSRPTYHFLPERNWMNDPLPCTLGGIHHVFFQYNPWGAVFSNNMSWGHTVTEDFVTWREEKVAMTPHQPVSGQEPYDKLGDWSGSCLEGADGIPLGFFTGTSHLPIHWSLPYRAGAEKQAFAHWSEEEDRFIKSKTPIIDGPPEGVYVTGFRDPFVTYEADLDQYRMLLGSGLRQGSDNSSDYLGGAVLMYHAKDYTGPWNYTGVFATRDDQISPSLGVNWECPQLRKLSYTDPDSGHKTSKALLLVGAEGDAPDLEVSSGNHSGFWLLGQLVNEGRSFTIESFGHLDGGLVYASNTLVDDEHDRLLTWGFISEAVTDQRLKERGWANLLSITRELFLTKNPSDFNKLTVGIRPIPQLQSLRSSSSQWSSSELTKYTPSPARPDRPLPFSSSTFELRLEAHVNPNLVNSLSILVRATPNATTTHNKDVLEKEQVEEAKEAEEVTIIILDFINDMVRVDRSRSSLADFLAPHALLPEQTPFDFELDIEDVDLTIYLDQSVVEVFLNNRVALTTRIYPTMFSATGIRVAADFNTNPNSNENDHDSNDQANQDNNAIVLTCLHIWQLSFSNSGRYSNNDDDEDKHTLIIVLASVAAVLILSYLAFTCYRRRSRQTEGFDPLLVNTRDEGSGIEQL